MRCPRAAIRGYYPHVPLISVMMQVLRDLWGKKGPKVAWLEGGTVGAVAVVGGGFLGGSPHLLASS